VTPLWEEKIFSFVQFRPERVSLSLLRSIAVTPVVLLGGYPVEQAEVPPRASFGIDRVFPLLKTYRKRAGLCGIGD